MKKPATTGVIPRKYKSGSIIYFENDKSEYIYILKSGRVVLTSVKLDTQEEVKEDVRQGEFFGVKSSLGKYPREETAQTIGDTVVLIMNPSDFEKLILRNVNVVRKMLRVFSNQLRRIGKTVRSVLGDEGEIKPEIELFKLGEYWYKTGTLPHARYAFKRYLEYYPDQQYAATAMQRIKSIDSGQASPGDADMSMDDYNYSEEPPSQMDDFTFDDDSSSDMTDFDGTDDFSMDSTGGSDDFGAQTPLSSEMDDFLSDDDTQGLDDFSFDDMDTGGESQISQSYHEANNYCNSGQYEEAIQLYKNIVNDPSAATGPDSNFYEMAHIEIGKCYLKTGMPKDAIDSFSALIKNSPNSDHVKNAYFNIGTVLESANKKDKAITYFNKVANLPPQDDLSNQAMNKVREIQGS